MSEIAFGAKGKMRPQISPSDAQQHVGETLFVTDWLELPETRVKMFRVGTFANEDDADMEQCLTNPVGYENVDGFMLVSLLLPAHFNNNPIGEAGSFGLNYAMENVRFPAPVFLGDRVRVVCTLTGNGLKDPQWALADAPEPIVVPIDADVAAERLGLRE